ncbi:hypothetical protein LUZ61_019348 [Rhynchospora tenuis]|uniref:NB-ARC domain-containing protein n=1 Tax=Rhynchospora tenuis TaxID=198213 RepID=A0AAD6EMS0_9POAL|nr:hypothetical protein LUZ61_019348 [Rhynchospora tenuis]
MESTSNFVLNGLSEKMSWTLFKQMAFNGSESGLNSQIHEIAKEIVKKCVVPLALKALGSAMKFKKNVKEWEEARDSDIWERDEGNEVMASLKLSYMNLSSQLKECFTYCSIFPKDHVINKQDLIGQWMANGLVSFTSTRGMEVDWGNEYFERLVQVSFLQNIVEQIDSAKVTCNMHDLVHDLAQSISDQRILLINDTGKAIHKDNGEVNPNKIKKMRALYIRSGDSDVINMVSEAQSLRSLFLESIVLYDTLFISISKLIHLRYICISDCLFTTIPNDISTLWSLEALHLRHFHMIKYFPESIGKLINLRTLELVTCMLTHLPKSIGHCQSLQNLIVSSTQITSIPNSLGQLVNLKSLNISYCYELVKIPEGAFGQFHSIRTLNLSHCMILKEVPFSIGKLVSLEILNMSMCEQLKWLPESIGNLHKLRFLNLHRCKSLEKVPESIGNLINIESLDLSWCENLKCLPKSIGNLDKLCFLNLNGCESLEKVPESIGDLINLESLDFSWCENLKCLQKSIGNLDKLCFLNLHGCENIQKVPESIGDLINLESLDLSCCKNLKYLPESIGNLDKLCFLNLDGCESLEKFPESIGNLINLEGLDFSWCKNLKYLPESIRNLDKLCFLNLDTCKSMETVTESIGHLINLESLDLSWCENLKCLPESIGNLDKLCFLNLHRCESLEKLPESIGNLINLESIDLSWCKNLKNLPESIGNLANLCVLNLDNFELNTIPKSIYNLRKLTSLNLDRFQNFYCMPAGISKLNGPYIQGLSIFSGVEDNKLACMSELKHLNIRGHLKICGLQNLNYPGEATQAKLKKKNLSSLKLTWCHNALNNCNECSFPVLEALQPPLSIKSLDLEGFPGKQYPNWMMVSNETRMTPFPNLTSLTLSQIKRCFNLPSLVGLPHLEYLTLEKMPYLTNYSGHFPSLVELYLREMPNLEEVTTMNLDTNNISNPAFPRLSKLVISGCPKVRIKPHLSPSVVELKLEKSNDELLGVEFFNGESSSEICSSSLGIRVLIISQMETQLVLLKQFSTITRLEFENYERNCLPESMRHLSSLRELKIYHCKNLHALPEWLGELKSLEELKIWCTPLTFLPQSMQHMNSLRQLWFWNCGGLHVLPEWFGELKSLIKLLIDETPLNCLPKSIKQLTTLQYLYIWNCPELERRYEHEKGEDWHLISHIPTVNIE